MKKILDQLKIASRSSDIGNYLIDHSKSEMDKKMAYQFSLNAGRSGDRQGMFNTAYCYLNGFGVAKNERAAVRWLLKLSNTGDVVGYITLAEFFNKEGFSFYNPKRANYFFLRAANLGHTKAMCELSRNYIIGKGCRKNIIGARYWLQKAAIKGNEDAIYELALLYDDILKQNENAFPWYLLAAEKGNSSAEYQTAFFYETGTGIEQNCKKAYYWYVKAAESGNRFAQERLLHLNPDGTENLSSYSDDEEIELKVDPLEEAIARSESENRRKRGKKILREEFGIDSEKESLLKNTIEVRSQNT